MMIKADKHFFNFVLFFLVTNLRLTDEWKYSTLYGFLQKLRRGLCTLWLLAVIDFCGTFGKVL